MHTLLNCSCKMLPDLSEVCVHYDATIDTDRAPAEQSLRRHLAINKSINAPKRALCTEAPEQNLQLTDINMRADSVIMIFNRTNDSLGALSNNYYDYVEEMQVKVMQLYNERFKWRPTQLTPKAIDENSKPIFVVVHTNHRTITQLKHDKFVTTSDLKFYKVVDNGVQVSFGVQPVNHKDVIRDVAEKQGIQNLFAFYPTWEDDKGGTDKVTMKLCYLKFSNDEIACILNHKKSNTHLVLCVASKESNTEDFALVDAPPKESLHDTIIVNGVDRKSLMALEWSQLELSEPLSETQPRVVFERAASRDNWPQLV